VSEIVEDGAVVVGDWVLAKFARKRGTARMAIEKRMIVGEG